MTADTPPLSVVIPVHDRAATVAQTLRSLAPALEHGIEVIAVDDGSRDGSVAVMEATLAEIGAGPAARVLRQANAGPGAARNAGAGAARAPWIAFLDSDDLWMPWTAPVLLGMLARPDPPALAFLRTRDFRDPAELASEASAPPDIRRHADPIAMRLSPEPPATIASCNLVIRRDALLGVGGFTTETRSGEDTDLIYRLGRLGPVDAVAAPVMMGYRQGAGDQLSRDAGPVVRGVSFLLARDAAGAYGPPDPDRARALAAGTAFAIYRLLREGHPAAAYRLLWRARRHLLAAGRGRQMASMLALPVLSRLRPARYGGAFRWRPPRGPAA